ncbi:MAG: hypothetical protein ACRDRK_07660 [Pseudonocardia sp.]
MHFILSGAFKKAVHWRWVAVSPLAQGEPPAAPKENPDPPTPAEAAWIVTEAWRDPDWDTQIWLAMTTGARRGEICSIRWPAVILDEGRESAWLRHGIRKNGRGGWVEAELKTHQQRRLALDIETVTALRDHRQRCEHEAAWTQVTELRADLEALRKLLLQYTEVLATVCEAPALIDATYQIVKPASPVER